MIRVQIESMTLNGFAGLDGVAFQGALSGELTRLISAAPVANGSWTVDSVQISAHAGADSAAIGVQVARAIFQQIQQPAVPFVSSTSTGDT